MDGGRMDTIQYIESYSSNVVNNQPLNRDPIKDKLEVILDREGVGWIRFHYKNRIHPIQFSASHCQWTIWAIVGQARCRMGTIQSENRIHPTPSP
jgi:hypothetical protein